ncbi:DDE superfamily endonuclease [Ceratobasidium sp. AG-Ba]|nr:DDE superfamily endonuclease [Ceratobasidium sp. AG-Ba]QRW09516.1 DDE superfamily endonuclease [Ceratobasidium sp. AG-Ba]
MPPSRTISLELSGRKRRSMFKILGWYRDFGTAHNPCARKPGRRRTLNDDDCEFIRGLITARPKIFLDEIQRELDNRRGVSVHILTISRTLANMKITRKSVTREARERDELLRAIWQAEWGAYDPELFVWLDESGVDDTATFRFAGWAPAGHSYIQHDLVFRGIRYTLLPALTTDGIVALEMFEGTVDRERFWNFIREQIAPILNPFSMDGAKRSIVVLDNCAIHHGEEIRQIVEVECGVCKIMLFTPYSPDFNPIEQAFSAVKSHLRRLEREAGFTGPEARPWLIQQAMFSVTPDDAAGWIKYSGYGI